MKDLFSSLTIYDWILTAIIAYFITHILLRISDFKKTIKTMNINLVYKYKFI